MTATGNPILDVRGLSKSFGALQAVRDFSARIEGGRITGLIGPNGAGKTTAFNMVSGFVAPDVGDILWRGQSINALAASARAQLGMVRTFQHTRVFSALTVFDNLLVGTHRLRGSEDARGHCASLLDVLGLASLRDIPAKQLPYGLAKVLSIGIALAAKPAVLLLDEPAAGLNTHETDALAATLRRIVRPDLAIWVIEHNMAFVMSLCETITVLSAGRLIAHGRPEEIRQNAQVQEAYLGSASKA